jgi:glycosyltransferase involved in cell wall biosynthesis
MNSALITTIIPTYRRPQLLQRALSSALKQTFRLSQVCVYDNASGDDTKEVVSEFMKIDSRVRYYCHPVNVGMIANYEFALKQVNTPYFHLLSDDDLIFPWFLEEAMQGMQRFKQAAFTACSTAIMSEKGEIIRVPLDLWKREGEFASKEGVLEMISKYPVPTCILFDQKVIQEFPIDRSNELCWDCDFLLRIAARYPIVINKHPCGIFLHHNASYSKAQNLEKWKQAHGSLAERICLCDSLPKWIKSKAVHLIQNDLKATHRAFAICFLFEKKFDQACEYAALFQKSYGWNFAALILIVLSRFCKWFPSGIHLLLLLRQMKRMLYRDRAQTWILSCAKTASNRLTR